MLATCIQARETNGSGDDAIYEHPSWLYGMKKNQILRGHEGCVNTLSWDASGRYLLSGSDDTRLIIWAANEGRRLLSVPTGHLANIFSAKFMSPVSLYDGSLGSSTALISCAADGIVRYQPLDQVLRDGINYSPPPPFECHAGMTYEVDPDPLDVSGRCFFSCSEDGTLNLYDTRIATSCTCHTHCNRHTYIDVNSVPASSRASSFKSLNGLLGNRRYGRDIHMRFFIDSPVGVSGFSSRPDRPMYIALACTDDTVRMYDRRFLSSPVFADTLPDSDDLPSILSYQAEVYRFSPSAMRKNAHLCQQEMERTFDDDSNDGENQDHERAARSYARRIARMFGLAPPPSHAPFRISSLCFDPAGGGDFLVSYTGEKIYLVRPTSIRDERWDGLTLSEDELALGSEEAVLAENNPEDSLSHESENATLKKRNRAASGGMFPEMQRVTKKTFPHYSQSCLLLPQYSEKYKQNYDRDILNRYSDHTNSQTMIKESRFFHPSYTHPLILPFITPRDVPATRTTHSPFIVTGSDDGHVYIYDKKSPDVLMILPNADAQTVNCIAVNPALPLIAVSGINSTIGLWEPRSLTPTGYKMVQEKLSSIRMSSRSRRNRQRERQAFMEEESESDDMEHDYADEISEHEHEEDDQDESDELVQMSPDAVAVLMQLFSRHEERMRTPEQSEE